jgi:high-affinity nickel-transport protein
MPPSLRSLFNDQPGNTRAKILAIYAVLAVFNLGAWAWAVLAFHHYPVLLGTAFLAYSFGLRHAVDADHIAAIDNVTRKLMHEGKRPVAVGFLFSLGHSTIVVVGSIAIAATALALQHRIDHIRDIGAIVGTLVSTLFLFAIAIVTSSSCEPSIAPSSPFAAVSPISTKTSTSSSAAAASSRASSGPSSA